MNIQAKALAPSTRQQPLGPLVRIGLAHYWREVMGQEPGWVEPLLLQAASQLGMHQAPEWDEARATAHQQLARLPGPFGRWVREAHIDLPQAFLLALIGHGETDYLVTLTLNELQAPNPGNRLSVHLALSILEHLFEQPSPNALDLNHMALVRQKLVSLDGEGPLALRQLRLEPALWSVLSGHPALWPGCKTIPLEDRELLPRQLRAQLPQIATLLTKGETRGLLLRGNRNSGRRALAAEMAELIGLVAVEVAPELWRDQRAFPLACQLAGWLPVIDGHTGETGRLLPAPNPPIPHVVVLGIADAVAGQDMLEVTLDVPDETQRRELWARYLDAPTLTDAVANALLSGPVIARLAHNARLHAEQSHSALSASHIAQARRELGAERLRLLAQPVPRQITREAMVLPTLVEKQLDDLLARARQRESVWNHLGITLQASRNSGVRALFVGDSGTGKTLAASYLATALGAPLYRVDLAAIMDKFVGESEKNLGSLLDLAAAADAVLLFDEADSLFGRRTEAKQSGERYANMLTNFLLTRIEDHTGIVVLTTNSRERIDSAFTRRLDTIVEFPMPAFQERLQLWHKHLGERSPGDHYCQTLASYCDLSGGQIRNAVLGAAGRSAGDQPVPVADLVAAVRQEYLKLGRRLPAQLEHLEARV